MTYVGERRWQPLDVGVRVSPEASLWPAGEGVALGAPARCRGEGVTPELSGRAALALRFISPAATAVETTGDVSEVRQERLEGGLSLALRLDGRARVEARYADISAGSSYL